MAEKEFIEREAASRVLCDACGNAACPKGLIPRCSYYEKMQSIPAADVRPVVLCRDCVNYVESDEANGEKMCVIDAEWCEEDGCYYGFNSYTEPDWFCAGGKKREES